MIDEYQDSNMVQELLLSSVSQKGEKPDRFMVGDMKQSIITNSALPDRRSSWKNTEAIRAGRRRRAAAHHAEEEFPFLCRNLRECQRRIFCDHGA